MIPIGGLWGTWRDQSFNFGYWKCFISYQIKKIRSIAIYFEGQKDLGTWYPHWNTSLLLEETFRIHFHRLSHFLRLWLFPHMTAGLCQHCVLPTKFDKYTCGGCEWQLVKASLAFIFELLCEDLHSHVAIFIHNPYVIKQLLVFMRWTICA